jgi:hypothetical protein
MKHDACLFVLLETLAGKPTIVLILSLHVDDGLCAGTRVKIMWLKARMEAEFGPLSSEFNVFKHFGVDVVHDPVTHAVFTSQLAYVNMLTPIVTGKTRGDGRTPDSDATASEVTEFRSLVSGIAWVGVTHAGALAAASLFQNCLPQPKLQDISRLNTFLEQLLSQYQPLIFVRIPKPWRLVTVGDSSLGNVAKYSQGGFFTLLTTDRPDSLCGLCNQLAYKSNKSKRVASSTMHAEALAATTALEETTHIQSWLYEIEHPDIVTLDLVNIDGRKLIPIVHCTDCDDLYKTLISPANPSPSNRALTLYLYALRELLENRRVSAFCWVDTRDCIANVLTKLNSDGTLPMKEYNDLLRHCFWNPVHPYRWMGQLIAPDAISIPEPRKVPFSLTRQSLAKALL